MIRQMTPAMVTSQPGYILAVTGMETGDRYSMQSENFMGHCVHRRQQGAPAATSVQP